MKTFVIVIFLLASAFAAQAQTGAQIEKELIAAVKEIDKYGTYGGAYDQEKLSKAQGFFEAKLLKYTKTPATLAYKFGALGKEMSVATSDDGRLRVYSWDLQDGGTMHNHARVYQYRAADGKVYSRADANADEDGAGGAFVTEIFTLDAGKNRTVYIVCSTFVGSTKYNAQSANLYRIAGDALDDRVKLIKTKSGLTNTLGFAYDFFSVVDRPERPIKLISFDKKTKTLKIPVVVEDKEFTDGKVTSRTINYQFNGTYFVKTS